MPLFLSYVSVVFYGLKFFFVGGKRGRCLGPGVNGVSDPGSRKPLAIGSCVCVHAFYSYNVGK